jgi:hypothetical protein
MATLFDSGIRPAIDEYLLKKSKEVRSYGDYWSASSAGYCMRKVMFERLGVPKIEQDGDERKTRIFEAGHIFHEWLQRITKDAGLSIASEVTLQDEQFMIRGHFDDLVLVKTACKTCHGLGETGDDKWTIKCDDCQGEMTTQHLILYDYKTQNSRAFQWQKKRSTGTEVQSHYHKMQLATYMYMLRKRDTLKHKLYDGVENLSEARLLKISKDDLCMREEQLLWTPALEKEVIGYWRTLNGYWKEKKIPKCTCADYEGGFLAQEKYNGYFYDGEPCSLELLKRWKKEQKNETT